MTILAHFACSPVADGRATEPESNTFRRARRGSGSSSAEIDYSEQVEEEPEHMIRRLKYERDLLKHQLGITKKQKEELFAQLQGMHYSSSCPAFPPYAASPRRNPLSPNLPASSPFSCFHSVPIDEDGAHMITDEGALIRASYAGYPSAVMGIRSTASSPTPGMQRSHGLYIPGYGSTSSLLDIPRPRPPLHVNVGIPRSRGTTPPVSPQQTSPNMSMGGGVLDNLDSIASSYSEAIRSDLQLIGLDLDEYENPDRKRADEAQAEIERLQKILEVERQERKGLDCRIRELEHVVEGLMHDKHDLTQQLSSLAAKLPSPRAAQDTNQPDRCAVHDQAAKLTWSGIRLG